MDSRFEVLISVLKSIPKYVSDEDRSLLKNLIVQDAYNNNQELIQMIYSNEQLRDWFFTDVKTGLSVFNSEKFVWIMSNRELLPNSYTRYLNKIGLDDEYGNPIKSSKKVVLTFPYKDCVLEGGQDKEDAKKEETFYNISLNPEKIDVLLNPKAFTNAKRISANSENAAEAIGFKENFVIKGNNLLAISSLRKKYTDSIKCIYIDPPYNTPGDFNTFSYNNTFNHSTWLTFMKNRLEVAKDLLSPDGVICIAIDDCEYAYLKVLCDEIFGRDNCLGTIIVKSNPSGVTSKAYIATCHEYLLLYAKDELEAELGEFELNEKQTSLYKEVDSDGTLYKWRAFVRTGGTSTPDVRPNSFYPIYADPSSGKLSLEKQAGWIEIYPKDSDGKDRVWRKTRPSFLEMNEQGKLKLTKNKNGYTISIKDPIKKGMKPTSIWADAKYSATHQGTDLLKKLFDGKKVFSYPKSLYAVKDIIKLIASDDDIVLDFFGGSGTTAHAVLLQNKEDGMNRKFIICEQMEYVKSVICERIKKVLSIENIDSDFIYMEMIEVNNRYVRQILESDDTTISSVFDTIIQSPYVCSGVEKQYLSQDSIFNSLSIDEKKDVLIRILDQNMIYLNYDDVEDASFNVSEEDIAFNHQFYEGC